MYLPIHTLAVSDVADDRAQASVSIGSSIDFGAVFLRLGHGVSGLVPESGGEVGLLSWSTLAFGSLDVRFQEVVFGKP